MLLVILVVQALTYSAFWLYARSQSQVITESMEQVEQTNSLLSQKAFTRKLMLHTQEAFKLSLELPKHYQVFIDSKPYNHKKMISIGDHQLEISLVHPLLTLSIWLVRFCLLWLLMLDAIESRKTVVSAVLIGLAGLVLFSGHFGHFFSHDDFLHFRLGQASNIRELLSFFQFLKPPLGFGSYRPLPTQAFYWFGSWFNFWPLPMRLLSTLFYLMSLALVYQLAKRLNGKKNYSLLALGVFALSASHMPRLMFLGAFQEFSLAVFYLSSLWLFDLFLESRKQKHLLLSLFLFVGALMSKEMAVTLPIALGWWLIVVRNKFNPVDWVKLIWPYALILGIYLYFHIFHYGFAGGDSYVWDISPTVFNTLTWYGLWAFGIPESFVDFVGSGFTFNSNLFSFFGPSPAIILWLSFSLIATCLIVFVKQFGQQTSVALKEIKSKKKNQLFALGKSLYSHNSLALFGVGWFVLTLAPVMFLPWHKFAFATSLPLFGLSILIASILNKLTNSTDLNKIILIVAILAYTSLQILSVDFYYKHHWVSNGGRAAQLVHNFLQQEYPHLDSDQALYFTNDTDVFSDNWGSSRQLSHFLSGSNALKIWYNNNQLEAYYQDEIDTNDLPKNKEIIPLSSRVFLGY